MVHSCEPGFGPERREGPLRERRNAASEVVRKSAACHRCLHLTGSHEVFPPWRLLQILFWRLACCTCFLFMVCDVWCVLYSGHFFHIGPTFLFLLLMETCSPHLLTRIETVATQSNSTWILELPFSHLLSSSDASAQDSRQCSPGQASLTSSCWFFEGSLQFSRN